MSHSLTELLKNLGGQTLTAYSGAAFRMHNPVWAWSPLSMEGAVRTGGRFNPKGSPALYLGLSVAACHAEVAGGATGAVLSPQLLCSYTVDIRGILDLRAHYHECFEPAWRIQRLQGKEPPGWQLYRALTAHPEINGLLVSSYMLPGESDLVLFRWPSGGVQLHDPDGRLSAVYGQRLEAD
ncbi:RES domain-containing protein [Vibrio mimicus]